jgi:hypothetical protein
MTERDTAPEPDAYGAAGGPAPRQAPVAERTIGSAPLPSLGPRADLGGRSPIRVVRRPSQQTAALRQELDEKAAATDELREALDELRQVLDVDNPLPSPGGRRGRVRLALISVSLLAVTGVIAYLVVNRAGEAIVRSPGAAPVPGAAASSAPAPSGTGTSPTGAPAVASEVRPLAWPGGAVVVPPGLTTSGPGVSTPGSDVQAALDDDGTHVDVVERLLLDAPAGGPLALLTPSLSVPSLPGAGRIGVTDLQVQLDDQVATPSAGSDSGRWTVSPPAGHAYLRATLRYRLGNGVVTVTPAAPGRAFGLVTPLTAASSQAHGHEVVLRTLDPRVIGVSCPGAAGAGSICGTRLARGWSANLPSGAGAMILLQVQR